MFGRFTWLLLVTIALWGADVSAASAASKGRQLPDLRRGPTRHVGQTNHKIRIPVTVHIASTSQGPAVSQRHLVWWVARTNRALAPYGIEVTVAAIVAMPGGHSRVTRWRERRDLAGLAPKNGTIHVFVVNEVDVGGRHAAGRHAAGRKIVRGIHWRYRGVRRGLRGKEYVVIADHAPSTTLAHEVGHLLGLGHDDGEKNLMCSCREGPGQSFNPSQGSNMRSGAHKFLFRQHRR